MAARRMPSSRRVRSPALREAPPAQQQRHHQVVADHGRDRDGLDDHHAGGRRQPADKGQQRQRGWPCASGSDSTKVSALACARPEVQQAAQRDGQHEQVDQQQVGRKHPGGAAQVALVDVLDHHHLELARQEDHRQHRQQRQREPLRVGKRPRSSRSSRRSSGTPARARTGRPGRRTGPR
jgi:hypothetical protein